MFLFYIGLVIFLIIVSEIGAHFWHRFGAHTNILPFVKETHSIHHNIIDDEAHADFIYICVLLFLYLIALSYIFSLFYILLFYLPVFVVFIWNWYIHSCYHIENHWLNRYEWFKNDKRIHFQHHINTNKNYGIATHFTDILLDTFDYGFPINNI